MRFNTWRVSAIIASMLATSAAAGEELEVVTSDGPNGTRYMIETSTIGIQRDTGTRYAVIYGYNADGRSSLHTAVLGCDAGYGSIYYGSPDAKFSSYTRMFWAKSGKKVFDAVAMAACALPPRLSINDNGAVPIPTVSQPRSNM